MNGKKIFSIKYKILIIFVGLILINIIVNILIVNLFMDKYYIYLKEKSLKEAFTNIKDLYGEEETTNELSEQIFNLEQSGITVKIIDEYNFYIYRSAKFGRDKNDLKMQVNDSELLNLLGNEEYNMVRLKEQSGSNFVLHLVGKINGGKLILSSPISVINENSKIAETFIIISSTITLGILAVIIYFFSKGIKKKIDDVGAITENISNLNFSEKIYSNSNDELGQFFGNINEMSTKLETAIKELKAANEKLKNENKELEKVEKMRKQLITNISHELKTPLTIISGYNQLLKGKLNEKKYNDYVNIIDEETEKLSNLVIEFLELSKIENNSDNLKFEYVNVKEIIMGYLDSLCLEISSKGIHIVTDLDENSKISSDLKSVKKIISNLVTNAIKYVENENIIKIRTYQENDHFILSIYNTCNTINDYVIINIFNAFYKNKDERNKTGTGLGLTIVKSIANNIGAECFAQNIEKGVEFKIVFKMQQ